MRLDELLKIVSSTFETWTEDETLKSTFNDEDLQAEFLKCIQGAIKSKHLILTEQEVSKMCSDHHDNMEGNGGWPV